MRCRSKGKGGGGREGGVLPYLRLVPAQGRLSGQHSFGRHGHLGSEEGAPRLGGREGGREGR